MPSALIVLANGCEEIETVTPADVLVRAGVEVVVASVVEGLLVTGSRGLPLGAHVHFDAVCERAFDLVFLPGGVGSAATCRTDPRIQALAARQLASGRWLATICAATTALVPQGLHAGRRLTSFPGVRDQLAGATWVDAPVVIDGNLVTSQGAGTAMAFALTLAKLLVGAEPAAAVARQMLAQPV
jgi:4-methyl-5(b-hydroxyethyl)-thiazole monophosphate biosynthesis